MVLIDKACQITLNLLFKKTGLNLKKKKNERSNLKKKKMRGQI